MLIEMVKRRVRPAMVDGRLRSGVNGAGRKRLHHQVVRRMKGDGVRERFRNVGRVLPRQRQFNRLCSLGTFAKTDRRCGKI